MCKYSTHINISYPHMVVSEQLFKSRRLCCSKAILLERQNALLARVIGLRKGHDNSTSNQHIFAANKQFKIILDLASFSSMQAFMEEDQQDSGGEYDLQEGFDRLMII